MWIRRRQTLAFFRRCLNYGRLSKAEASARGRLELAFLSEAEYHRELQSVPPTPGCGSARAETDIRVKASVERGRRSNSPGTASGNREAALELGTRQASACGLSLALVSAGRGPVGLRIDHLDFE